MKAKEKAKELVHSYIFFFPEIMKKINIKQCKECALVAVENIILANPHSNPFNTDVYSTMEYWQEVKKEIQEYTPGLSDEEINDFNQDDYENFGGYKLI